jgi:DNA polymerase III epsilon subunit family exonuclease
MFNNSIGEKMIIFDTETTGLIKNKSLPLVQQPHIIEIGAIRLDSDLNEIDAFSAIINPGVKLEPIITKITGLADKDLADAPTFGAILPDFVDFVFGTRSVVAHNLPFDMGMLWLELRREQREYKFPWWVEHIDTIDMAKPHYGGKFMKLEKLYEDLIGPYEQQHRALDDCRMLLGVYRKLKGK